MSKKILLPFLSVLLIMWSTPVFAELFSVSVGIPVSHSFTGEDSSGNVYTSDGVAGVFAHAKLPIMVGLGIENYKTNIKSSSDAEVLSTTMYDIFYLLPIPIVNLSIGLGAGTTEYECSTCLSTYDSGTATQVYASLGVPFFPFFDVHLSFHKVNYGKIEKSTGTGSDKEFKSGNVTGLGFMFGF